MNLERIGLDTSKAVLTLHGVGEDEKAILRRDMRRAEMEAFFAKLPPTHVTLERRMKQQHEASPVSQPLAAVPGIGPIGALSLALTINPGRFTSGRHFAAWLGLVPKVHSTGGRQRLGSISHDRRRTARQIMQQTLCTQGAIPTRNTATDVAGVHVGHFTNSRRLAGVMQYADFMHGVGSIRVQPARWSEMFVPALAGRDGS